MRQWAALKELAVRTDTSSWHAQKPAVGVGALGRLSPVLQERVQGPLPFGARLCLERVPRLYDQLLEALDAAAAGGGETWRTPAGAVGANAVGAGLGVWLSHAWGAHPMPSFMSAMAVIAVEFLWRWPSVQQIWQRKRARVGWRLGAVAAAPGDLMCDRSDPTCSTQSVSLWNSLSFCVRSFPSPSTSQ